MIFPKEMRKTAGFRAATKGGGNATWQKIIAFDRDKTTSCARALSSAK